MKHPFTKISLIIVLTVFLSGCDATKRVPEDGFLLTENEILVDGEETENNRLYKYLYQRPNTQLPLIKVPLRLYIYNLARPNLDSILDAQRIKNVGSGNIWEKLLSAKQVEAVRRFKKNFNEGIKKTGEPPAIVTEDISAKSANKLNAVFVNDGYFNAKVDYEIKKDSNQRASVIYKVTKSQPYYLDTITPVIASKVADSIYQVHKDATYLLPGERYQTRNINLETQRIEELFRNNGLYHFESDLIRVQGDTVNTGHKANLEYIISNRTETINDSIFDLPFKVHKVSQVNIITDYNYANRDEAYKDSLTGDDGFHLYAFDKINYRSKALTDIIPLKPGSMYRDIDRSQTLTRLSRLSTFKYPSIQYTEDPADSTRSDLIANIRLTPLEKYKLRADFDVSTSNIQDFGIAGFGSLLIRNIFKGAETLEISGRGSIGASNDANNPDDSFFNISEVGADVRLTFPRIFFPANTQRIIPPEWQPNTRFNLGIGVQQNIGLDKQNVAGTLTYNWKPKWNRSYRLDPIDVQYVRNLNPDNYFNVYRSSYDDLNDIALTNLDNIDPTLYTFTDNGAQLTIPTGAEQLLTDVANGEITGFTATQTQNINAISERQQRLTENNLIVSLNFTHFYDNRENIFDETFSRLRTRVEFAGNALGLIANLTNRMSDENGTKELFGVNYSQYVKTEIDYSRHWDLGDNNVVAARAFGGIAIPYGNADNIPFTRSFFAGGSNDNRAWRAYDLGPGSSGSPNEFNEANMKLAFNLEYRFDLIGPIEGALFADAGNIWNVFDNVEDEGAKFSGFKSLKELALGSGFGLRWDFDFFVIRFDTGFKTYNPALPEGDRWFKQYNFRNAVYNVGVNYPF